MSPFECWLVLRGTKTLAVRMKQHDENGRVMADFLGGHRKVKKVFYPGLKSHPQYELACRQMSGFGSMITFETGSLANAKRLLKRVRLCTMGESLGGVETLISHPATMTHAAIGEKGRKAIGLTDGMVRISVGIEDVGGCDCGFGAGAGVALSLCECQPQRSEVAQRLNGVEGAPILEENSSGYRDPSTAVRAMRANLRSG